MTGQATTRTPFNKANLDAIPFAEKGKQTTYYDTNKTNLALRVGASSKTFIVYTRPKGSTAPVRITLGKYGEITIKQASDLASKELAKIADGHNPVEEKKQAKAEKEQAKAHDEETFKWMMDTYKNEQIIAHKGGSKGTLHNVATTMDYFDERTIMTLKKKEDGTWENDMEVQLSSWLTALSVQLQDKTCLTVLRFWIGQGQQEIKGCLLLSLAQIKCRSSSQVRHTTLSLQETSWMLKRICEIPLM